ncbi:hypothetical protein TRFO_04130 [Tritrichomonas foetus]|uniref:Uncharacterized protein n=1 Tax=Tritrichomonas foetus TaxID=1144522 RepID=A0A1J4KLG1_9EUKA|nr:hypothetical protein TRFO_04130 [Tritrichomonas foetus]|eukprot:OHT10636.1 hypothetical protein TRFO_04130 [Tritrichomonas foetus]
MNKTSSRNFSKSISRKAVNLHPQKHDKQISTSKKSVIKNKEEINPTQIITEMNELKCLQISLCSITYDSFNLEEIKKMIIPKFSNDKERLYQLILSLFCLFISRPHFEEIYIQIFELVSQQVKIFFSSEELFLILKERLPIRLNLLLYLMENHYISIECLQELFERDVPFYYCFFYPEIKKLFPNRTSRIDHKVKGIKNFKEKRKLGMNDDPLYLAIRFDKIDEFQQIISLQNISLISKINFSFFECISLIEANCNEMQLIDYAALFGSVKVFRYIFLNRNLKANPLPITLPTMATFGGNVEIIRLVEQSMKVYFFSTHLETAIFYWHNDIAIHYHDVFNFQYGIDCMLRSIFMFNIDFFLFLQNENLPINLQEINEDKRKHYTALHSAVTMGSLLLVKYLLFVKNADPNILDADQRTPLYLAVKENVYDIAEFLIQQKNIRKDLTIVNKNTLLMESVSTGNMKMVQLVLKYGNINKSNYLQKNSQGQNVLDVAKAYSNYYFGATKIKYKKIHDYIISAISQKKEVKFTRLDFHDGM